MKYILLSLSIFFSYSLKGQDMYKESFEIWEKINNSLIDAIASFSEYPQNHENTIKVFEQLKQINSTCKNLQIKKYALLTQYDEEKIRRLFKYVDNIQTLANDFEELLRTIAGYNSRGIAAPNMETVVEPILIKTGWQKHKLNIICNDAYFYEYTYKGFKMMFIKSTRPKDDYYNNIYNTIFVNFTYSNGSGWEYAIGGNLYRMIQFKDEKYPSYYNIIKATSRRNAN